MTEDLPQLSVACLTWQRIGLQDMASWARDGVAGLQSVVLYSLPELDGAIDAIPLGGLVGDGVFLSLERARKLAARIKRWVTLRRTPAQVLAACWLSSQPVRCMPGQAMMHVCKHAATCDRGLVVRAWCHSNIHLHVKSVSS